jgi:hypothetical protein
MTRIVPYVDGDFAARPPRVRKSASPTRAAAMPKQCLAMLDGIPTRPMHPAPKRWHELPDGTS